MQARKRMHMHASHACTCMHPHMIVHARDLLYLAQAALIGANLAEAEGLLARRCAAPGFVETDLLLYVAHEMIQVETCLPTLVGYAPK